MNRSIGDYIVIFIIIALIVGPIIILILFPDSEKNRMGSGYQERYEKGYEVGYEKAYELGYFQACDDYNIDY